MEQGRTLIYQHRDLKSTYARQGKEPVIRWDGALSPAVSIYNWINIMKLYCKSKTLEETKQHFSVDLAKMSIII